MKNSLDESFLSTYKPLLKKFVSDIKNVNPDNLPVPFLPSCGSAYENSPFKLAFVGWETRGSSQLCKYISSYNQKNDDVYYWFRYRLEDLSFLDSKHGFMSNSGRDFWGFILQFLAKFYGIDDWKELKKKEHPSILRSFVWGNVSSIERFKAANRNGAKLDDYFQIKEAGKVFDKFSILLNVFKPNIVVLLCKEANETWITNELIEYNGPLILNNFLKYYYIKDTNTHVYKTYHPGYLSRRKVDFNDFVFQILDDISNRQIFSSYPGEKLIHDKRGS